MIVGPGYPLRYMQAGTVVEAHNGAVIAEDTLKQLENVQYLEPTVEQICEGVWAIGGVSIATIYVIQCPDGVLVQDTGADTFEAGHVRPKVEEVIKSMKGRNNQIKALLYTHSHFGLGGGALVDDPKSVIVLGHPKQNASVEGQAKTGGINSVIPEIGPVLALGGLQQFAGFLPEQGPDAAVAEKITVAPLAYLPVTDPVEDGETRNVLGMEMQFFTKYVSDDNSVTTYIPSIKAVINNFVWAGTPNLYSIRGAVYRDPREWLRGLKVLQDLEPEILLNELSRPIVGKERCAQALEAYADQVRLIYDQSLRAILNGGRGNELKYCVYIPEHLRAEVRNAQTYGEISMFTSAPYGYCIGGFDRDVTKLFAMPERETAIRLLELIGGVAEVCQSAEKALASHEYAWAAQLIQYAYLATPDDPAVRDIKARACRHLGQLSTSAIGRSWLLTEALICEGKATLPPFIPPRPEVIAASATDFVDYFRVRIDPQKAEGIDCLMAFFFGELAPEQRNLAPTQIKEFAGACGLHCRRGVVEFVAKLDEYSHVPNVVLAMKPEAWAELYLSKATLAETIAGGAQCLGDAAQAEAMLACFDVWPVLPAEL